MGIRASIGQMASGCFLLRLTVENADNLRGLRAEEQAQIITQLAGMMWSKVQTNAMSWSIQKSRNFAYHPNTYTVYIQTNSIDALYPSDYAEMAARTKEMMA